MDYREVADGQHGPAAVVPVDQDSANTYNPPALLVTGDSEHIVLVLDRTERRLRVSARDLLRAVKMLADSDQD